jgi:bifunctional UDP-N-acetylglucosamine pyrophosphorylase/glucosamine-1-phosphate N-acetyltransferase
MQSRFESWRASFRTGADGRGDAQTPMTALSAIILAAGKGKRMQSDLPKVAHEVADRAMVRWVAEACAQAGCERIVLVVGHGQEIVRAIFEDWPAEAPAIEYAVQDEQLGTGHAVQCALPHFSDDMGGDVFVLAGDGPLIRAETLTQLHELHTQTSAQATMATSVIDDPTGYGRIARDGEGRFAAIVEHKNCTPEQLEICEINPSYYCFKTKEMFDGLQRVQRDENSGEWFLTDVPGLLLASGGRVEVIDAVPPEDVLSINTPDQLAAVDHVLRSRLGMPVGKD